MRNDESQGTDATRFRTKTTLDGVYRYVRYVLLLRAPKGPSRDGRSLASNHKIYVYGSTYPDPIIQQTHVTRRCLDRTGQAEHCEGTERKRGRRGEWEERSLASECGATR